MLCAWEVYFITKKAIKKHNVIIHLLVQINVQMFCYNVVLHSLLVVKCMTRRWKMYISEICKAHLILIAVVFSFYKCWLWQRSLFIVYRDFHIVILSMLQWSCDIWRFIFFSHLLVTVHWKCEDSNYVQLFFF